MTVRELDRLRYTRCGVPTALGLAAQLGWLERELAREGVVVESLRDSDDRKVRQSHYDHSLKYSVRQGGSSPAIWSYAAGRDTRVIGLIWTDESQQILTLPGRGINSVRELKGRRLALPQQIDDDLPLLDIRGSAALRGFLSALSTEGLTAKDVELVKVARAEAPDPRVGGPRRSLAYGFGEEVLALLNGEVDAIFVKDARGKAIQDFLGAVELIDVGAQLDPALRVNYCVPRPLTVDRALLTDHPKIVERILGLVLQAGAWARQHPRETVELVAREVNMPAHYVERAYPNLHLNLHTDLREDWIAHFTAYKDFLYEGGFLARDFELSEWIDPAPLAALKRNDARLSAST